MRAFVYGFDEIKMHVIRWHFGKNEYIDVSDAYQDILALMADIVVVNIDSCDETILESIRQYESETKGFEERNYIYVSDAMFRKWRKDMLRNMPAAVKRRAVTFILRIRSVSENT